MSLHIDVDATIREAIKYAESEYEYPALLIIVSPQVEHLVKKNGNIPKHGRLNKIEDYPIFVTDVIPMGVLVLSESKPLSRYSA